MRTQVGIIGSGPAGLLLSQLLHLRGIDNVVLERQSREYVLGRIRAGVIEQGAVELLREARVHERLDREGQIHEGIGISFGGRRHRIDFRALTGACVTVYGQTEITRDLFEARDAAGGTIIHDAEDVTPHGIETDSPFLTYRRGDDVRRVDCDFIAGVRRLPRREPRGDPGARAAGPARRCIRSAGWACCRARRRSPAR